MTNQLTVHPKKFLTIYPYMFIEKNPNGTGGGLRLRINDMEVDVVWGEMTYVEILEERNK